MFRVTLTVENEIVVDRVLDGIETRARDFGPVWVYVLKAFQAAVQRAFDTEGASTGAPWNQLAKSTQAERKRRGYPAAHPILVRSGALERALTLGEGAYASMTPTSLTYILSSDLDYFKYHQSAAPRTKLPRRAPVLLTADDRYAITRPIRLYLTGRDVNAFQRQAIG